MFRQGFLCCDRCVSIWETGNLFFSMTPLTAAEKYQGDHHDRGRVSYTSLYFSYTEKQEK